MKTVLALILAVAVIIYVAWKKYRTKQYTKTLLQELDANPAFANDIAVEMQHFYGYEPNPNGLLLKDLLANIEEGDRLGDFEILRKIEFDDGSFLLVTMSHEKNYFSDRYEREHVSIENYQLSFLIKGGEMIKVWSDYYESLPKRFLREAFARELFQRTKLQ